MPICSFAEIAVIKSNNIEMRFSYFFVKIFIVYKSRTLGLMLEA